MVRDIPEKVNAEYRERGVDYHLSDRIMARVLTHLKREGMIPIVKPGVKGGRFVEVDP